MYRKRGSTTKNGNQSTRRNATERWTKTKLRLFHPAGWNEGRMNLQIPTSTRDHLHRTPWKGGQSFLAITVLFFALNFIDFIFVRGCLWQHSDPLHMHMDFSHVEIFMEWEFGFIPDIYSSRELAITVGHLLPWVSFSSIFCCCFMEILLLKLIVVHCK